MASALKRKENPRASDNPTIKQIIHLKNMLTPMKEKIRKMLKHLSYVAWVCDSKNKKLTDLEFANEEEWREFHANHMSMLRAMHEEYLCYYDMLVMTNENHCGVWGRDHRKLLGAKTKPIVPGSFSAEEVEVEADSEDTPMELYNDELSVMIIPLRVEMEYVFGCISHMERILRKEEQKARDCKGGSKYKYPLRDQVNSIESRHKIYLKCSEKVIVKLGDQKIMYDLLDALKEMYD